MNKKELVKLIKSKSKPTDADIDEIYQLFLDKDPNCFEDAHQLVDKDLDEAHDHVMTSYEMWLYDLSLKHTLTEKFIDDTRESMSESIYAALT